MELFMIVTMRSTNIQEIIQRLRITSLALIMVQQMQQQLFFVLLRLISGPRSGLKQNITMIQLRKGALKQTKNWSEISKTLSVIRMCQQSLLTLPQHHLKLRSGNQISPFWMQIMMFYSGLKFAQNS